jgi:hypothetical protein
MTLLAHSWVPWTALQHVNALHRQHASNPRDCSARHYCIQTLSPTSSVLDGRPQWNFQPETSVDRVAGGDPVGRRAGQRVQQEAQQVTEGAADHGRSEPAGSQRRIVRETDTARFTPRHRFSASGTGFLPLLLLCLR